MDDKHLLRFWTKVDKTDGCWNWTAANTRGYGDFCEHGKIRKAHRISYELAHGEIPTGRFIAHHCDNPACVRPDHLFVATPRENTADMIRKGRHAYGDRNGLRLHPETIKKGSNHPAHKLHETDIVEIRRLRSAGASIPELARMFSVHRRNIELITTGRAWRHVA